MQRTRDDYRRQFVAGAEKSGQGPMEQISQLRLDDVLPIKQKQQPEETIRSMDLSKSPQTGISVLLQP
jgi:hypothetical protein